MATETKKKMSDFFNAFSNPSGGLSMNTAHSTPAVGDMKKLAEREKARSALATLYGGGTTYGMPVSKPSVVMPASPAPGPMSTVPTTTPPVVPPVNAGVPRGTAPVAPASAPTPVTPTATPAATTPAQWLRADGTTKTPEEVAAEIAAAFKGMSGQGDVGKLAAAEINGAPKTAEQLRAEAGNLSAIRNDIASGESDPYGVGATSGIAWTPEQLSAIEKAQAGIYDPAINTVFAKLETRGIEEEARRKEEADAKKAEADFNRDLELLAKKHGYDMEAMKADQGFQMSLAKYKASLEAANKAATESSFSPYVDYKQSETVAKASDLLTRAIENPELFGKAGAFYGSLPALLRPQEYNDYVSQLDSLKNGIFSSEIQSMRADSQTGGAVGQVAVAEMTKMENALASLETLQSAELVQDNLKNVIGSINRYRTAKGTNPIIPAAPAGDDGEIYGLPGYVSDGTQWVLSQ